MHLSAELTAAFWTLEPFGEIGANFSLQLSSRTRFDKINKKKVIAENQCEKHKTSSLVLCAYSVTGFIYVLLMFCDLYVEPGDTSSLILNAPITTKVVCFSSLLKCLRSLCGKQCGPRPDCSYRAVCSGSTLFAPILNLSVMLGNYLQQTTSADDIFRCIFFLAL